MLGAHSHAMLLERSSIPTISSRITGPRHCGFGIPANCWFRVTTSCRFHITANRGFALSTQTSNYKFCIPTDSRFRVTAYYGIGVPIDRRLFVTTNCGFRVPTLHRFWFLSDGRFGVPKGRHFVVCTVRTTLAMSCPFSAILANLASLFDTWYTISTP